MVGVKGGGRGVNVDIVGGCGGGAGRWWSLGARGGAWRCALWEELGGACCGSCVGRAREMRMLHELETP